MRRLLTCSGLVSIKNTVVIITVPFVSKQHGYMVDVMVTVQCLKNNLYKEGVVPLSPDNQCIHFQEDVFSDEQHLHECGIRQGSEVYIHYKGDHHKEDHGADSGTVQTFEVGRQEGLSSSNSEVPVSKSSKQGAAVPIDIDSCLVNTASTAEETELPAKPERALAASGHDTTGRTVINTEGVITVYFNFQPRTFTVNFKATVRNLKDDLYCQGLVFLSPEDQCTHFRKEILPDEQQLHECGIQHGSKVYIHFKRDDLGDHSTLDGGISPAAIQPSSTQERRWISMEPNFNVTRKTEKNNTEEGIKDSQTHLFPGICGHWTQDLISNSITKEKGLDISPCGLLFELLATLVDNEREQRCSAYDTEITYYRARKRIIDEMKNQISSENNQPPKQPHSECDKLSITRKPLNIMEESLDYIHGLWNKISEQFHLPQRHVVLHDIECIWVTWHIPAKEGTKKLIAEYIPSSELFLKENNITSIIFNDECLFCQVKCH